MLASRKSTRQSSSKQHPGTKLKSQKRESVRKTSPAGKPVSAPANVRKLLAQEISFIDNETFTKQENSAKGRRKAGKALPLPEQVEAGLVELGELSDAGLPNHLARMCDTPLLSPEEEAKLFERMNYCKYRADLLKSRLKPTGRQTVLVREIEDYVARSERIRNYLIQANTRLVMSIARKFADQRNAFDDLLSQGIASLMHAVEKFDFSRGYRFSTYATCAVRRDLYRMVMNHKKDGQRFSTGNGEQLDSFVDSEDDEDAITETTYKHLSIEVAEMMKQLDDREKLIVASRFGFDNDRSKTSYSQLGDRLGISKERVRQLANRALDKLRDLAEDRRLESLIA